MGTVGGWETYGRGGYLVPLPFPRIHSGYTFQTLNDCTNMPVILGTSSSVQTPNDWIMGQGHPLYLLDQLCLLLMVDVPIITMKLDRRHHCTSSQVLATELVVSLRGEDAKSETSCIL